MVALLAATIIYLRRKMLPENFKRYISAIFRIKSFFAGIVDYIRIIPLVLIAVSVNYYILYSFAFFRDKPVSYKILQLADSNFKLFILFIFVVVLAPPVEELFFRGCFYRLLNSSFPPRQSALISGFGFAAVHGEFYYLPSLLLLGYLLARVYEKRKNLAAPVAFHSFHNLVAMVLYYVVF
ncbi:MAG: CPBP family intramembrane glutamic endopeptidase [bacterium]